MASRTTYIHSPFPAFPSLPHQSLYDFIFQNDEQQDAADDPIIYVDDSSGQEIRLNELRALTTSIAYALRHRLGLEDGSTLVLFSVNHIYLPVVAQACLAAGIICSTANAMSTVSELVYQIQDSGAQFLLCSSAQLDVARLACKESNLREPLLIDRLPVAGTSPTIWDLVDPERHLLPQQLSKISFLLYSSGTSGRPKGCKLSHSNYISAIMQAMVMSPSAFRPGRVWLAALPMTHAYALFLMVLLAPYIKAKVVIMGRFNLERFVLAIETHRVTACHIVPPIAVKLAKDFTGINKFSTLKEWVSAAAPLGRDLANTLEKKYGVSVESWFAMTETAAIITMTDREHLVKKPGSVGRLGPNMDVKIVDGELCLRGPNIMLGYHNRPEVNALAFDEEGFMRTGDRVHVDEDGFFFVIDRVKEIIKYNGYQVSPAELEDLLLNHPDVKDAAVIGINDYRNATELPMACIVLKAPVSDPDLLKEELISFVAKQVAPYKKLRGGVAFIDAVPKSPAGKILRRQLRDMFTTHSGKTA